MPPGATFEVSMDDIKKQEPITMYLAFDTSKSLDEENRRFLKSVEVAREAGGGDVTYRERGPSNRILQFPTYFQYAMFNVHVWGEFTEGGSSEFCCKFPAGLNPYWVKAAKAFLRTLNIRYELEVSGPDLSLQFGKFAWRAAFQSAVEDGTIDRLTRALWQADLILGKPRLRNFDLYPVLPVDI